MKGYARERSPRALHLIEELREAVLKPEAMKPKGFSDLDRLVMGENEIPAGRGKPPRNAELDLDGITVIYLPEPKAVIRNRLEGAGHPHGVIEAVLQRAEARRQEYQKYLPEFKRYTDDGSIPIEFNYRDNDSLPFAGSRESTRPFEFETLSRENGPVVHVPRMADADGQLKYISGDSLRAVRVVPEFTRFARRGRKHLMFFDGGIKSLQKALVNQADQENAFALARSLLPPRPVFLP